MNAPTVLPTNWRRWASRSSISEKNIPTAHRTGRPAAPPGVQPDRRTVGAEDPTEVAEERSERGRQKNPVKEGCKDEGRGFLVPPVHRLISLVAPLAADWRTARWGTTGHAATTFCCARTTRSKEADGN